jgi:hypothetical protein
MQADPLPAGAGALAAGDGCASLQQRLERGEVIVYPSCPFALPQGEDRDFLLAQGLRGRAHKNISYDPATGKASGFRRDSAEQAERLRLLLADFAERATAWLAETLPGYARCWQRDRVSFRPEEEATRRLRLTARNDLLHVDAFPSRPTQGWLLLRLFVNVNPTEPRVWLTSDTFPVLLERYGTAVGLPSSGDGSWAGRMGRRLLGLFHPARARRTEYDAFMLRLHDFLKSNEEFQERSRKRVWTFAPGSMWLVFTDVASHAALRGRYALEHSYFVAAETLLRPEESPPALLARACAAARRPLAA